MTESLPEVEIAIIGAGLSGLATALLLAEAGRSVLVIEARAEPGGRIRSVIDPASNRYLGDLGPTWVWPAFQPTIARWIDKLDLSTFPQYDQGLTALDHGSEQGVEHRFLPSQTGSQRLDGGPQAMVDRLVDRLPAASLRTGSPVIETDLADDHVSLTIGGDRPASLTCRHLVVAIPPRIAAAGITWRPALPVQLAQALESLPTWMAPHAKMVALYDRPFWRERGLSGRIVSQVGPLVEAHDHSGPEGTPAAIFGFIGWPHTLRKDQAAHLEHHLRAQLQRSLGIDGPAPLAIHVADWATDPFIATPHDLAEPMGHPSVGPDILRAPHADGRLWFAGSETAERSPGLIEGAFFAAEQTVARIIG